MSPATPVEYESSRGVLWLRLPAQFSADELQSILELVEQAMEEHRPRIIVRDASLVKPSNISPVHRSLAAAHFERLITRQNSLELEVFVLPHPLLRGIVTAVSWFSSPPWERHLVSTRAEAEALVGKRTS